MDARSSAPWGYLILCAVVGFTAGLLLGRISTIPRGAPIQILTSTPAVMRSTQPVPKSVRVYVSGAVRYPAVYELPPGSLVRDAVEAAGGPAQDADLERINLAQELQDQQHLHVPRQGEMSPPVVNDPGTGTANRININTARADELEELPRIGPAMAQRIVEYRQAYGPFQRIEDIQNVAGIGPATFEAIRDLITVE